jgi:hypothetical protein
MTVQYSNILLGIQNTDVRYSLMDCVFYKVKVKVLNDMSDGLIYKVLVNRI